MRLLAHERLQANTSTYKDEQAMDDSMVVQQDAPEEQLEARDEQLLADQQDVYPDTMMFGKLNAGERLLSISAFRVHFHGD